jgi:hypothetical protein
MTALSHIFADVPDCSVKKFGNRRTALSSRKMFVVVKINTLSTSDDFLHLRK